MHRLLIFIFLLASNHFSAQTVGLFLNDSLSFNGYTLFAPSNNESTYLIDNCGFKINSWNSPYDAGMSAYLLENGDLLRAARVGNNFISGGTGGRIELFNWQGEIIWAANYSTDDYKQHHDIEPLPNGNFLAISWDKKSISEAIEAGRKPNTMTGSSLWSEKIVEIEMIGTDSFNVVWEWHLWDHLVQDFEPNFPNYGVVADHLELIDINYVQGGTNADWIHANAIDYNPELDQIIISSRNFNEFWVIDHSTTIAEAASHQGGNSGKGGDILYRWGNPQTYQRGDADDKRFFGQHDVQWIEKGLPDEGKIMIFNNGQGRTDGNYSSVDIIEPPIENDGNYAIESGIAYGPIDLFWTYVSNPVEDFYSSRLSGAQRLPNGNTLICEGRFGHFFEINPEGTIVWDYINPIGNFGPTTQGNNPNSNDVFRALRYGADYEAFEDKDLIPGEPLEIDPLMSDCEITEEPLSDYSPGRLFGIMVKTNPINDFFQIENQLNSKVGFEISNLAGQIIFNGISENLITTYNGSAWKKGIYFIRFFEESSHRFYTQKMIKL